MRRDGFHHGRGVFIAVLAACLCLTTARAWASVADDIFADLRTRLTSTSSLCADFYQERTLKALSRPLESRGSLIFRPEKGILWRIDDPFAGRLLITETDLYEIGDDGTRTPMGAGRNVIFRTMTDAVLGLLSGEPEKLRAAFDIDAESNGNAWRLSMSPKRADMKKAVSGIIAEGVDFIRTVKITDARGDVTDVTFSHIETSNCVLSEPERELFEF